MSEADLRDEIARAATAITESYDPELFAATASLAENEPPPSGPLSQAVAAAWLRIPRRTLRTLIERGRLHVAEDGGLYAADLAAQFAALKACRASPNRKRV